MKKSIYEILCTVAENNNLTIVETTSEANGYPSHISFSIIGFNDKQQFHAVEQELNKLLCVHKNTEGIEEDDFLAVYAQDLHRHNGWRLWHREYDSTILPDYYDMYDIYKNECNCYVYNYGEYKEEEFVEVEFTSFIDDYSTIEDVRNRLNIVEKMWTEINSLEEGLIGICYLDTYDIEIMDRYVMSYTYDIHNYTKALTIK